MTFQQLNYLLEIGKTGSVTGAAKNLFVSSSSISISLTALEKELGYPLFNRTQKGLVPTEQGKLVLDYADQICRTHTLLNAVGRDAVRTIRINSTDQPPIAKAFAQLLFENKDRTDLRIENVNYSSVEMYQKMVEHEVELSLSTMLSYSIGSWEKRLRKGGLHRQILKTVPAVIQVGPGHRLYHASSVSPTDLEEDILVEPPSKTYSQDYFLKGLVNFDPGRIIVCANNGAARQLIIEGLAYSIVPLMPDTVSDVFHLRRIPIEGISFRLYAITNPKYPTPPEVKRYLDILEQALKSK